MTDLIDDVSKQASALNQAFKDNQQIIRHHQAIHDDLKDKLSKEKDKFEDLVIEGNFLYKHLCILVEDCNRRRRKNIALKKEIEDVSKELDVIRINVLNKTNDVNHMERQMIEYDLKMASYREGLAQVEKKTPLMKQVSDMQNLIQALLSEKSNLQQAQIEMLRNEEGLTVTKPMLLSDIEHLEQQIVEQNERQLEIKKELESDLEKRKGLELKKFVLKKRNSAILIRMKREVEEQKEIHSTFVTQKDYLVRMINSTKQKLQRFGECI